MMKPLTEKAVADLLTVSPNLVLKMARKGDIPCRKIGLGTKRFKYRFVESEIEAWLKEGGTDDGQKNSGISKTEGQKRDTVLLSVSERETLGAEHKTDGQKASMESSRGKTLASGSVAEKCAARLLETESDDSEGSSED